MTMYSKRKQIFIGSGIGSEIPNQISYLCISLPALNHIIFARSSVSPPNHVAPILLLVGPIK